MELDELKQKFNRATEELIEITGIIRDFLGEHKEVVEQHESEKYIAARLASKLIVDSNLAAVALVSGNVMELANTMFDIAWGLGYYRCWQRLKLEPIEKGL